MGQPVNPLLGNQQALLGADPELYRQQLIQQEQARIGALPAQSQLGATLGTLLGRGLVNVAQDRGFFEVTNPVLQKLTTIQSVYNTAMQSADPNDPLSFYRELQTRFADAGLGQQAFMATQELRKAEDLAEKAKGEKLRTQVLETEVYTKNPTLLDEQIAKARAAGNDTLANRLAEQRGQIQINIDRNRQKEDLDMAVRLSNIKVNEAQVEKLKADIDSGKVQIVSTPAQQGSPAVVTVFRNGKKEEEFKVGGTAGLNLGEPGTGGISSKPGERPPLSTFAPGGATPAPAPAAQPRKVGAVEQQELNRLEQRRLGQETAAQTIAAQRSQGRTEYDALVARAAESGLVPMGMSGSDIVFINPTTGQRILGSQL